MQLCRRPDSRQCCSVVSAYDVMVPLECGLPSSDSNEHNINPVSRGLENVSDEIRHSLEPHTCNANVGARIPLSTDHFQVNTPSRNPLNVRHPLK